LDYHHMDHLEGWWKGWAVIWCVLWLLVRRIFAEKLGKKSYQFQLKLRSWHCHPTRHNHNPQPPKPTWTPKDLELSSYGPIGTWWTGWAVIWCVLWLFVSRIFAEKLGKKSQFLLRSCHQHQ
jgi:hypothetical protein